MQLDAYRREAGAFISEIGLEHYRHYAGLKPRLEIEAIYEAHASLFTLEAAEELRDSGSAALLEFCVEGLLGRATTRETAELADREAALELELGEQTIPFRRASIEQAAEQDPERRELIEQARLELTERELNPLHENVLERMHELTAELGWPTMTAMCSDLSGIDLEALADSARELLAATEQHYERTALPRIADMLGVDAVRRSDLPAFFRAPSLDVHFPEGSLIGALTDTLADLGIDSGDRVRLDAEVRPTKSPRAFCAAVQVPDEVYLVISPHGGRDDYETLLHEAGHSLHYAHAAAGLELERRHLGDNSVTEAYAFLLQRLAGDPAWLARHLAVRDAAGIETHARDAKLVLLRRYAAKLCYEVELHGGPADQASLRDTYAKRLGGALRVEWPKATWLSDVDPFFYAARYLRAWAFEAELASELATGLGPEWFTDPDAGERLRELWAAGQPANARELLGHDPDFTALTSEVVETA